MLIQSRFIPISCAISLLVIAGVASASSPAGNVVEFQLAYIDPGAGSFLVQALVAMVAGIAVTGRVYWSKIKSILGLASAEEDEDAHADDD